MIRTVLFVFSPWMDVALRLAHIPEAPDKNLCTAESKSLFSFNVRSCDTGGIPMGAVVSHDIDEAAIDRAQKARGHEWSKLRLNRLFKTMASTPTAKVKVAVLGNSVTKGHGLENTTDRWSDRLQDLMKELGYVNFETVNLAVPATHSKWAVQGFSKHINTHPDFMYADLILVDYSVTDTNKCCGAGPDIEDSVAKLIQLLLKVPKSSPPVIFLETFTAPEQYGFTCAHTINEFPHMKVLQQSKMPIISYYDAVCPEKTSEPGWNPKPHPDEHNHDKIARVVAGSMLQWMQQFCLNPNQNVQDHPLEAFGFSESDLECAVHPPIHMDACFGQESFPAVAQGWSFEMDSARKPGWIAKEGQVGTISFTFTLQTKGRVELSYLQTYQHIGSAECWLDELFNATQTELNGLDVSSHTSFPTTHRFDTMLEPGRHMLTCRSKMEKFKITSLLVCKA